MRKRKSETCVCFPARLRCARGEESQRKVAEAVGVSPASYSQYESGLAEPTLSTLINLAEHFGVSIDYLLGRQTIFALADANEKLLVKVRTLVQEAKALEQCIDRVRQGGSSI